MEEYPFANKENKTNDEVSSKNIGVNEDKEKVDSLTMEYSSLSPAEHQVMTKLAADIKKKSN